jgi:hypothetical protein
MSPDEYNEDLPVAAHSSVKLTFREQDHFDWGSSTMKGRAIFIRLHLGGKSRPLLRKVYG